MKCKALWTEYMPNACPWCGAGPEVRRPSRGGTPCNNSWHPEHPEHDLMWPTFVRVIQDEI